MHLIFVFETVILPWLKPIELLMYVRLMWGILVRNVAINQSISFVTPLKGENESLGF